jgi:hypothetical protein
MVRHVSLAPRPHAPVSVGVYPQRDEEGV